MTLGLAGARRGAQGVLAAIAALAIGDAATAMACRGAATRVVEFNGRTVIPGLIDSHRPPHPHPHPMRGGL